MCWRAGEMSAVMVDLHAGHPNPPAVSNEALDNVLASGLQIPSRVDFGRGEGKRMIAVWRATVPRKKWMLVAVSGPVFGDVEV